MLEREREKKNIREKNEEGLKNKQELRKKKMEGVLVRSRARWIGEGEKVSNFFLFFSI